jgi:hypothetical protein
MTHPMLTLVAAIDAAVDEVTGVDPIYMNVEEKKTTLTGLARARARVEAVELKVLAAADDIAEATGDRCTATWLATETRDAHGTVRRNAALASALDQRWVQAADALGSGDLNKAQARVIADALAALPKDLGVDLLTKAETLPNAAPTPPPACTYAHMVTAPPTSTPGSPTTPPAASAPTSTPTPPPAATTMGTTGRRPWTPRSGRSPQRSRTSSRTSRSRGNAVRRSSPCWRTSPPSPCPVMAAPPPR